MLILPLLARPASAKVVWWLHCAPCITEKMPNGVAGNWWFPCSTSTSYRLFNCIHVLTMQTQLSKGSESKFSTSPWTCCYFYTRLIHDAYLAPTYFATLYRSSRPNQGLASVPFPNGLTILILWNTQMHARAKKIVLSVGNSFELFWWLVCLVKYSLQPELPTRLLSYSWSFIKTKITDSLYLKN